MSNTKTTAITAVSGSFRPADVRTNSERIRVQSVRVVTLMAPGREEVSQSLIKDNLRLMGRSASDNLKKR